jgi:hypothetical protein
MPVQIAEISNGAPLTNAYCPSHRMKHSETIYCSIIIEFDSSFRIGKDDRTAPNPYPVTQKDVPWVPELAEWLYVRGRSYMSMDFGENQPMAPSS